MTRTVRSAALSAVLAFLSAAVQLSASSIFTNLGSAPPYKGGGYAVGGPNDLVIASSFVPSESATLTDVLLPLDGTGSVTLYIESDSWGEPSGTFLDTLTTLGSLGGTPSLLTYTCSICSELQGGAEYFLVAQQTVSADQAGWNISVSDTDTFYFDLTGTPAGPWTSGTTGTTAFEVDGTPAGVAPEPSSLLLLGAGLLGLGARGRRLQFRQSLRAGRGDRP